VHLVGTPGNGTLRYDAAAPEIVVPGLGGYTFKATNAQLKGSILSINTDISANVNSDRLTVGKFDFASLPFALQWWHRRFTLSAANTTLWGGENGIGLLYDPAEHPAWQLNGTLKKADVHDVVRSFVPWLDVDADGSVSVGYLFGQDRDRQPTATVHGALTYGRIGGVDLFTRVLQALAAAEPSLAIANALALVPAPRTGKGTRVDSLFFEAVPHGDAYDIGSLALVTGDFRLDADGSHAPKANGLALEGTLIIPASVADKLAASAAWIAPLRAGNALLVVPVVIRGKLPQLTVALAPGYADTLARAKRGEPVTATTPKIPRHVGSDNIAIIPGDPKAAANE
jgi:hypothetical protein